MGQVDPFLAVGQNSAEAETFFTRTEPPNTYRAAFPRSTGGTAWYRAEI